MEREEIRRVFEKADSDPKPYDTASKSLAIEEHKLLIRLADVLF